MKTLLILGLFISLPSSAGYSASDDGACLNPEPIATLNVEEASCVGKPCECYTRVYREQILGLEEKRVEKIDQALEKTYIEAATSQMRELMDLDILISAGEGKILDSSTNLARSCSFDSLASVLTCKNAKAKRVVKALHQNFLKISEFDIKENQSRAIKSNVQCLTTLEKRGLSLLMEKERGEERLKRSLEKIPKDLQKDLLKQKNPWDYLSDSDNFRLRSLKKTLEGLPLIKQLFADPEGVKAFFDGVGKKGLEGFLSSFSTNETVMKKVRRAASSKCEMIFKSIDTLACGSPENYFVEDEKFNNQHFSYYPKLGDSSPGEETLENHLFYCESKRCRSEKAEKCFSSNSSKEKTNYDPEAFLRTLGSTGTALGERKMSGDKVEYMEGQLCPALVCPDVVVGELAKEVEGKTVSECSPLKKEKKNPMLLLSELGCSSLNPPEVCQSTFAKSLDLYSRFYQSAYQEVKEESEKPIDESKEEEAIHLSSTGKTTKRSEFVENFMGEIGKDIDAFFSEEEGEEKEALAEENHEEKSEGEKNEVIAANKAVANNSTGKMGSMKTGAQIFNSGNDTAKDTYTELPVSTISDSKFKNKYDSKKVREAMASTRESIAEAKKWREAYQNELANVRHQPKNNIGPENSRIQDMTPNNNSIGNNTTIVNNYNGPEEVSSAALPGSVEIGNQEEYGSLGGEGRGVSGKEGRKPAAIPAKTPSLMINYSKLSDLDKSLLKESSIDPLKPFLIKIWVGEGREKQLVEVAVENTFYKGKLILKPVKDELNSDIFNEVLNSPIFFEYRNVLAEREERRDFFNNVLPAVKEL